MTERVLDLEPGTRVQVLAPVVRDRKGIYKKELEEFRRKGFVRVRIDGEMRELATRSSSRATPATTSRWWSIA